MTIRGEQMIKLAVFDLDGTLAPVGKPISERSIKKLKRIEDNGVRIVISSGKPVYYLIGMFRQVGIRNPVFIGENGGSIAYGNNLPPKFLNVIKPDNDFFVLKNQILHDTSLTCGDNIWLQPNEVMLTLFFKNVHTRDLLKNYFVHCNYKDVIVYEHVDSFDVVPRGVDKKSSLKILGSDLGITSEEMIAVGDGENDIPMFEYCKYSIGLYGISERVSTFHFDSPENALTQILKMVKK